MDQIRKRLKKKKDCAEKLKSALLSTLFQQNFMEGKCQWISKVFSCLIIYEKERRFFCLVLTIFCWLRKFNKLDLKNSVFSNTHVVELSDLERKYLTKQKSSSHYSILFVQ